MEFQQDTAKQFEQIVEEMKILSATTKETNDSMTSIAEGISEIINAINIVGQSSEGNKAQIEALHSEIRKFKLKSK